MAFRQAEAMDDKTSKHTFPFLKKGMGLQRLNAGVTKAMKEVGEGMKRKANFSPKKDERTKKPLVEKQNENVENRVPVNITYKYSNKKSESENIAPGAMKLRPRGKQPLATQPKPPPIGLKGMPKPRPILTQNYNPVKTAPEPRKKKSKDVARKSNCNSGPASIEPKDTENRKDLGRSSVDSTQSDDNLLYVTALEECLSAASISDPVESERKEAESSSAKSGEKKDVSKAGPSKESSSVVPASRLPPGVDDFDRETWNDPFLASCYAQDIFSYLKSKEGCFVVDGSYLTKHRDITARMRALLVDWMVEVQETFELNHETLYLGVKIVDLFLTRYKGVVAKEKLQLIGGTAVFIASKFDDRNLPTVEDFKLICDGVYSRSEFIAMEMLILKTLDFQLGIPISYRFLRRYARCIRATMQVLTLARYILETSLMEYDLISRSDSKMGAASLLLALKMLNVGSWNATLEYYSGYKLEDIKDVTYELNAVIHKDVQNLLTIKNKYSHRIFLEVATVPLLDNKDLGLEG
ncbi:G2/mitotic-specific cyclin-B3 [Ischnura elegans]|uniref:G2/mitotic-specific cyclin-B3 n=1 Tax=Ischnura elegans TaxID=197161 RepID=UPI001ED88ED4|nr:G2/mitotic-specific cyclin-B3 [Ischnura elegans]